MVVATDVSLFGEGGMPREVRRGREEGEGRRKEERGGGLQ